MACRKATMLSFPEVQMHSRVLAMNIPGYYIDEVL
jgi:hypothetical protein